MSDAEPTTPADSRATASGESRATAESPWPVRMLASKLKEYIDRLGTVWIEGEITQWGERAGNVYGKLKDLEQDATVDIRIWSTVRARFTDQFAQGDRVIALVKPDYWVKGGTLSMQVHELRHVGLGELLERLERLRRQFAEEGLFAPERKVPLPFLPQCIGLVTGKDSDAEKDVITNARLRWPDVRFRVRHAMVQGDRAAADVAAGIRELDADPDVDVIIVARGGGDFQNLLVFSDEALVRAAAACVTPLVSAIGHENDHPLLDDVADLRASTPTDAAKRVVPDVAEQLAIVRQARSRALGSVTGMVTVQIDHLAQLRTRPSLADPESLVRSRAEELTRWVARGSDLVGHRIDLAHAELARLSAQVEALSPKRTLDRGYAVVRHPDGKVLRSPADAKTGDPLRLLLAEGELGAVVSEGSAIADR